ncbi:pyridoxal phosphate-dependent aminotransferase domain-containing protein (plasmid) [Rhizobium etli 8C-3]|uniref:Pyridoxal phosphate-dependent aminotransferase domain-containing protein n=2 Tax=Rhizobium TaxID=379 RepID=A0A1L5PH21_RHIET|nr:MULTISPECIES: aminotransferase class I/II-fold pyridoxal phosphate-dependent enzyme [Rhizobium]APO79508.1 pyridoxal phosphate-dependent aminotransferase domain-containing protein [Rhizobium etli 8C-3]TCU29460.1 7-keto-8-aminopelargonate synthetase-like enzyme [Rhizobium azibense]
MQNEARHNASPPTRHRNTASLVHTSAPHFAAAHLNGLMALYARPLEGRKAEIRSPKGKTRIVTDFVRCSYLGLDNHPAIAVGAMASLLDYRSLHWSCARTRLNFAALGDLEDALSDLFGARIITYTTVLAANMSALPIIASGVLTEGVKPFMVFDRLAHATLAYNKPVVAAETDVRTIAHNDLAALEEICQAQPCVAYICDGVYSMGGNAPIAELLDLQRRYGLFLYIDDAHGVSIFGEKGAGFARSQIPDGLGDRTILAASLGKGFGASGGILMLGTAEQEEIFRRFAIAHAFSASINVAAIGAAMASQTLHRTGELKLRQERLASNIALFDELVPTAQSGSPLPIRTVVIGDELAAIGAARSVLDTGSYVSAIFFPTVASGRAGLRVCPTADHSVDEIKALAAAISNALER